MKHITYILLLVTFAVPVVGQEKINWLSIEEAVVANQENPRKFIIDVYTDWCGWCKRMDATTFSDEDIASYINDNFHAVKLDGEHKEEIVLGDSRFKFVDSGRRGYNELAAVLLDGRLGYPSVVYLNEKLERLTVSPGYKTVSDLQVELAFFAEEAYKETDFDTFRENYNNKPNPLSIH